MAGPYLDLFIRELPHYAGSTSTYGALKIEVDDATDESKHLTLQEAVEAIAAKRGPIGDSNLTITAGNRILGRQNVGAGAVQELSFGGGLSVSAGVILIDHGGIGGLGDDDHTQYHTDARGDARYPLKVAGAISGAWTEAEGTTHAFGTTTGTKFGTATNQKIGFYGVAPVVQQTAVPNVSGGATVDAEARTALNNVLTRLRALGFIAAA